MALRESQDHAAACLMVKFAANFGSLAKNYGQNGLQVSDDSLAVYFPSKLNLKLSSELHKFYANPLWHGYRRISHSFHWTDEHD
jgi:hypothetical protein